jgi:hypothetical protein
MQKPRPSNAILALKAASSSSSTAFLTEDKIDWLIDTYLTQLKSPFELLLKTLERSRDRFQREFSKLEALME